MRRFGATRPVARLAVFAAALLIAAPRATRANVEEFSTFDIALQEKDDESTLDHFLTRLPRDWNAEWDRSHAGLRTSQGCLTSGEWFIDTDLKARAPLGNRAWLGIDYLQSESDILSNDHLDLSFHFPIRAGTLVAMFRPTAAKAAQDFAIGWEAGDDTTAFQMKATWTIEDIFNNFWAFRQTQVGGLSEPYEKRPYEPALLLATRHRRWKAEANAKWLTSSTKRIVNSTTLVPIEHRELWGVAGHALAEATLGACTFEVRTDHRQARGHETPIALTSIETLNYRRQWSAEGAVRTTLCGRTTIETRYLYQWRLQRDGPVAAESFLGVDDRLVNLDVQHVFSPRFSVRAGGLFDRIGVARERSVTFNDYPTRNESRGYIGVSALFGRVRVAGIEGIELDPEPYDVWFVHDKGFLQLQTTF